MKLITQMTYVFLGLFTFSHVFAACGYIDRMTIVAPEEYRLLSYSDSGMVRVVPVSTTKFDIVDIYSTDDSCVMVKPGYTYVRIGDKSQENYCDLTLKDSPYIWEPKIEASDCAGSAQVLQIKKSSGVPAVTKYQWYDIVMSGS